MRFNARDTLPELEWHEITRYGKPAGDMLAAFELLLVRGSCGCGEGKKRITGSSVTTSKANSFVFILLSTSMLCGNK